MSEFGDRIVAADKLNKLLVACFANFWSGYPEFQKGLETKLTYEQQWEMLIGDFKAILQQVKKDTPILLTDYECRRMLLSDLYVPNTISGRPSLFQKERFLEALKEAEEAIR